MKHIRTALLALGLLLAAGSAWGVDYVVATNGVDTAPCTKEQPCKTITKTKTKVKPGDTLYVRAGTYKERIASFPAGESWERPTRLSAYPLPGGRYERVVLQSPYTLIELEGAQYHHIIFEGLILDGNGRAGWTTALRHTGSMLNADQTACGTASEATGAHHIRFLNLEIKNGVRSGIQISVFAHDNEFLNLNVHHNGGTGNHHGVYGTGYRTLIDGGEFHHNTVLGIQHYHNFSDQAAGRRYRKLGCPIPTGSIILNATMHHNGGWGGVFGQGTRGTKIYNNVFYANGSGAQVAGEGDHLFAHNTVWGNERYGLLVKPSPVPSTITRNILQKFQVEPRVTVVQSENLVSGGKVPLDPLFVDAAHGDFRLLPGSPAIDVTTPLNEVLIDRDGTARVEGAGADIGAYESIRVEP